LKPFTFFIDLIGGRFGEPVTEHRQSTKGHYTEKSRVVKLLLPGLFYAVHKAFKYFLLDISFYLK